MGFFQRLKAKVDAWFDEQQRIQDQKKSQDQLRQEIRREIESDKIKGAEGRLEEAYGQYLAGEMTLSDYRDEILREQQDLSEDLAALRLDRPTMSREEFEDETDRIDDDREAIRWRLQWVTEKISDAESRPEWLEKSGKWARFSYTDDSANESRREIVNWKAKERYVIGYDRKQKAERTFRQDRISDWSAG